MRRIKYPRTTAIYFTIAFALMVFIKLGVMGGWKDFAHLPVAGNTAVTVDEKFIESSEIVDARIYPGSFPQSLPENVSMSLPDAAYMESLHDQQSKPARKARVVVIIDDMGMNRGMSEAAINLPAPVTLAFLPYAPKLGEITARARKQGHELMIHVPMEPVQKNLDPGPMALMSGMKERDFKANLEAVFKSFDGYKGINNHMGSRLTQKPEPMGWVMEELAERGLYFVDSRTINASVAGEVAAAHGVRFAGRDVFLDHENSREFVLASLQHLEDVARRNGMAVAIGHPKEPTITALAEWIPTLAEKGIELVPASSAARVRSLKTSDPSRPDVLRRTERGTY